MDEFTNDEIKIIVENYKKQKQKEKDKYDNLKDNEEYIIKNRERARLHYSNNKHIKKERYENNKDFLKAKSLLQYYKYNNKVDVFKDKHPGKVDLLFQQGITC